MRAVLVVAVLFFSIGNSSAQNYLSVFGATHTKWHVSFSLVDLLVTDSFYFEKDTIVSAETWKKIKRGTATNFTPSAGLVKEDLQAGKIWYKSLGNDTSRKLIVDYNLVVGDTFNINSSHKTFTLQEKTVDSVYFVNGKKHIRFRGFYAAPNMAPPEQVTFIEGTGTNLGLTYKDGSNFIQYLLCHYKDGMQVYTNKAYAGQCWISGTALQPIEEGTGISVFPNPFTDRVYIRNTSGNRLSHWELYSSVGSKMAWGKVEEEIRLPNLPAAVYYLILYESNGNKKVAFLLKK